MVVEYDTAGRRYARANRRDAEPKQLGAKSDIGSPEFSMPASQLCHDKPIIIRTVIKAH